MADKSIAELPALPTVSDETLIPAYVPGAVDPAQRMSGRQFREFVSPYADTAERSAAVATDAAEQAQSALSGVREAIENIPEGSTPIVNDLTTGGVTMALSAEMGKKLLLLMGQLTAEAVGAQKKVPALDADKQSQLYALMEKWRGYSTTNLIYDFSATRNSYAVGRNPFGDEGRVRLSCDTLCLLAWAGVDPDSFIGKADSWDGTLVKAFDWGYQFQFSNRPFKEAVWKSGASAGKPYGLHQPDPNSYVGAYSYNSYYDPASEREDKQVFRGFMSGSDMAHELFLMGCEVPLSEVQVGDIVFFKAARLNDNKSDDAESGAFRNISHLALVYNTSKLKTGALGFLECTDWFGEKKPVQRVRKWTGDGNAYSTRALNLESRIVMVARHPAAFGIVNPVPDAFDEI